MYTVAQPHRYLRALKPVVEISMITSTNSFWNFLGLFSKPPVAAVTFISLPYVS